MARNHVLAAGALVAGCLLLAELVGAARAHATADELGLASRAQHDVWRAELLSGVLRAGGQRRLLADISKVKELGPARDTVDIGIISAFSPEVAAVLDSMDSVQGKRTAGARVFFKGKLGGKTVAVTASGESMVNSAMTTQLFLDTFNVSRLIFSGIAGGVNPANNVGDVLIPDRWANPQEQRLIRPLRDTKYFAYAKPNSFVDDTFLKLPSGEYASFTRPNATQCTKGLTAAELAAYRTNYTVITTGFALPTPNQVITDGLDVFKDNPPAEFFIPVDPGLLEVAKKVAKTISPLSDTYTVPNTNTTFKLDHKPKIKVGGLGVSASTFVDNAEYRQQLYSQLKAESCDMESTSFMQVCASNKKACIVIRSVSDLAGADPRGNQVMNFFGMASAHSSTVLAALVEAA